MSEIERLDGVLEKLNSTPLSSSLPSVLSFALECKDYQGYCLLAHWYCPLCDNVKANAIQRNEIIKTLMLQGLLKDEAQKIEQQATEQHIDMKRIDDNAMLAHSVSEMEVWLDEYREIMTKPPHDEDRIKSLNQRKNQIERRYELLRSLITSKMTYYRQILKNKEEEKRMQGNSVGVVSPSVSAKVFIVHGHNGEMKEAVARLVEKQGIKAVILHEQANQGATIIEKFERNSDVGCAICLFSADDVGRTKDEMEEKKRARQNVVFEAGYFIGKLGRKNVILIADSGVEIPSDLQGVVYADSKNWRFSVLQELKAIGFKIDYNRLD